MATYAWPNTGRKPPKDVTEHANCLKTDFELVDKAAIASLSNQTRLPVGLKSRISIGIKKGIAEARSCGYCPKWSEVDESIFGQVMLKSIAAEAALEARDRIPLPQFSGLHESYDALYTKIGIQVPATAAIHPFVGTDTAVGATSVVDLVNAAKSRTEETGLARTPKETVTVGQGEKASDGRSDESENDASEGESDMDEAEDEENGQEKIEREDSEEGDDSSEDGSSVCDSDSEDDNETDSDLASEENPKQDTLREVGIPYIHDSGKGSETTIQLRIKQQASVNRLELMKTTELLACLRSSLKDFLCGQQLSSLNVQISDASGVLEDGNVRVVIYAKLHEALRKIVDLRGWDQVFERTLTGSPAPTYKIRMHKVETRTMNFRNRIEKSAVIRTLACVNHVLGFIRDIFWSGSSLPKSKATLIVEFSSPEHAAQTLESGLYWQEMRHPCEMADGKCRLLRCGRCQGYGHLSNKCSAPHRCGKCAGYHATGSCKSKKLKCVSCGGGHRARAMNCPVKAKARRSLGFVREIASPTTRPTAEAQETPHRFARDLIPVGRTQTKTSMPSPVSLNTNTSEDEVKSKIDQSLPEANPSQDAYPDTATLLKQIEDLRKIVVTREIALQTKSSCRTKRRAEEAFAGGADADSSSMAVKRVKQ